MKLTLMDERRNTRIYEGVNRKGERVSVWATRIVLDFKDKKSIASAWIKAGFITEKIPDYWSVENFVTLPNGDCYNRYNPQIKFEDGQPTGEIIAYKAWFTQKGLPPFQVKFESEVALPAYMAMIEFNNLEACEVGYNVYFRANGIKEVK